ncbi:aldolase/citrate lyase family protein [Brevibacillus centrosporus]|uniref:HpcH/HpaI aldolase family protein n=1 Tax=Brevibacillus centrosporus TaxID=54910 RepID=UPI003D19542B
MSLYTIWTSLHQKEQSTMHRQERDSSFKERLRVGAPQLGTFVKIYSAEIIELLGMAGFDFIVIDMEHTTLSFSQVEQMVRVADLHGMTSMVRIPDATRSSVLRALDLGATGIQIPQLYGVEEVKDAVDKAKYPPEGSRGVTYAHRAAGFGNTPPNYLAKANQQTTIAIHIETESAYDQVDAICQVEGWDVAFIGPVDLGISLGVGADYLRGGLAQPVHRILEVCQQRGKQAGIAVTNEEQYRFALQHQIPYIVWASDVALFKQGIEGIVKACALRENA